MDALKGFASLSRSTAITLIGLLMASCSSAQKNSRGMSESRITPLPALFGRTILLAMIGFGPGCAAQGPIHDYCQIAKPIILEKGEAAKLSDATAREILTHNESGAKICGWK